jgi:hypothetical protein
MAHKSGAATREAAMAAFAKSWRRDRLFILQGIPAYIRSDNGPEFVANAIQEGSRLSVSRPPTSSGVAPGRTATSRASTLACATSCSRAKSSTLSARPKSSSRAGGGTTTRLGAHWRTLSATRGNYGTGTSGSFPACHENQVGDACSSTKTICTRSAQGELSFSRRPGDGNEIC